MAIFNSYVKLPEGIALYSHLIHTLFFPLSHYSQWDNPLCITVPVCKISPIESHEKSLLLMVIYPMKSHYLIYLTFIII